MAKKSIYKSAKGKEQILQFYDEFLEGWTKPSRQFHTETKFGQTFIIESGDKSKPSLLLLHGAGSNSAMWMADIELLSEKYHIYAIDILGECGKSAENRLNFKQEDYSNWLAEIFEILNLKTTSIISCSLGGWIALDFSIKYPNKVGKLVLLATAGITQVKLSAIFWITITSIAGNWGFRKLNKMVYGNLKIDVRALKFASLVKMHFKPRTDALPIFTNAQLEKIRASVLFIGGENDCFYNSRKTALRLSAQTKAKYFILENTGHVLISQTNRIIQFLNA